MAVKDKTKNSRVISLATLILCAGLVSACSNTSQNWQHPSKPKDLWSKDIADCKSRANALISRDLDIEGDSNIRDRSELQSQFAIYDARKKRFSYFTNCLSGKGYRQVSPK